HAPERKAMAFTKTTQGSVSLSHFVHNDSQGDVHKNETPPHSSPCTLAPGQSASSAAGAVANRVQNSPRASDGGGFLVGRNSPRKGAHKCAHTASSSPPCSSQPRSWLPRTR